MDPLTEDPGWLRRFNAQHPVWMMTTAYKRISYDQYEVALMVDGRTAVTGHASTFLLALQRAVEALL